MNNLLKSNNKREVYIYMKNPKTKTFLIKTNFKKSFIIFRAKSNNLEPSKNTIQYQFNPY